MVYAEQRNVALGTTASGLTLQDSALKPDCSSAAPLQVTSPQFPPEAPSVCLQGGIDSV